MRCTRQQRNLFCAKVMRWHQCLRRRQLGLELIIADVSISNNANLHFALAQERARYTRAVQFTALAVAGKVRAMKTFENKAHPGDFSAFVRETAHFSILPGLP